MSSAGSPASLPEAVSIKGDQTIVGDKTFSGDTAFTGAVSLSTPTTGPLVASQTTGDIITAASSTTTGRVADVATGQVLKSGGVGAAPAYAAIGGTTAAGSSHNHVFTGTAPTASETELTSGTGFATAGQVITTTGNFTVLINAWAGCWFIGATTPPCLILSNTAVTGAPAVITVYGAAPATDAGTFKILRAPTTTGTNAAEATHTHSGTGLT